MKYSNADHDEKTGKSAPDRRIVLASCIFFTWVAACATILYFSGTGLHNSKDAAKQSEVDQGKDAALSSAPPVKDKFPYSTLVEENGRQYRQFHFPDKLSIGSIGTIAFKPLGPAQGKVIHSATEVVRSNVHPAQGFVKFPANEHLSFMPGQIIAIDPSYLGRFRPGEIFDVSLKQSHEVDVDVYVEGCTQIKGITRLDLSDSDTVTEEGLPVIDEYESLKQLSLKVSARTAATVAKLSTIQKVDSLGLYSKADLSQILDSLKDSTNLKALNLQTKTISNEALSCIAAIPMLEELSISSTIFSDPNSTNNALKLLGKAPHLKVLSLQSTDPKAQVLTNASSEKILQSFNTLTTLQVGSTSRMLKARP